MYTDFAEENKQINKSYLHIVQYTVHKKNRKYNHNQT